LRLPAAALPTEATGVTRRGLGLSVRSCSITTGRPVSVEDHVAQTLVGGTGARYTSPAQGRDDAVALIRLLLGCPPEHIHGDGPWQKAIAGGRRTIVLRTVDQLFT